MPESPAPRNSLPEMLDHYQQGAEAGRMASVDGSLELVRTQEIIGRFLPPPPAVIYDVGGGPGVYACWLARLGYEVHLVDPVPLHVEQALEASGRQPDTPIASCTLGDARQLHRDDASVDAALLLGPLYHLTERDDRLAALCEAARVVRPGGYVFAAAISRFASVLDGMVRGFIADPAFRQIMAEDLQSGQHRNPENRPHYFTTTYFHRPAELQSEFEAAGLTHLRTLAIEGPAALVQRVADQWDDSAWREQVLDTVRQIEAEPDVLGASPHLLTIGRV
jgi:ubiquinone/menaquinone biosynthesis C-methylase UbiE